MKLTKLQIKNFRSLNNLEVDLEEYISIIVGKNNSGKTSLLLSLERFLSGPQSRFEFDDFNIGFQKHLIELMKDRIPPPEPYLFCGISLRFFIEYSDDDDLANVGNKVIMDLDPANRWIVLDFLYHLPSENLDILKRDFAAQRDQKKDRAKDALTFLQENYGRYFKLTRRSVLFDHVAQNVKEDTYVDLAKEDVRIEDIISFKRINARRSVSNKNSDHGLSSMSAKIYSAMSDDAGAEEVFETFKEALGDTDGKLDKIYSDLFKDVIADVQRFGGIQQGETQIKIKSTLRHRELLEENTTVKYGQSTEPHFLPESHNGLGYLNLISIIFEIKIILNEFKRGKLPKPADINLLFIEEPEAHTHPQMQAVFIKNIKNLIGKFVTNANGITRPLQTLVSTHSAHIVAESDFDDIKYFLKTEKGTCAKSLRDLDALYKTSGRGNHYTFLKQYLTLHRSQLFFADKAILFEGDTERILLPAMMRKKDQLDEMVAWKSGSMAALSLLSQNISLVEVGAHAQIFEIFLDFIGVKTLIITDIDAAIHVPRLDDKGNPKVTKDREPITDLCTHPVSGATHTTNHALKFFFGVGAELPYFVGLATNQKTVRRRDAKSWEPHANGLVMCVYQVSEADEDKKDYHARSFEDAFFHVNRVFMKTACGDAGNFNSSTFPSLKMKHLEKYLNGGSSFEMASNGISKKPSFAIEVLLNSDTIKSIATNPEGKAQEFEIEFSNWQIPKYIEEGLAWVKTA
ncbi:AAA family ATPase [Massilia atriviolacea]|uniref:AAA family ATPase n=1 Tax=Massilia atriviolacea TaxID=2495579 RepID=UPI0013DEC26B|nr:ATP-dependent endonuclease [Massilia atriviolacea]